MSLILWPPTTRKNPPEMGRDLGILDLSLPFGSRHFPSSDGQDTDKHMTPTLKLFPSVATLSSIGQE